MNLSFFFNLLTEKVKSQPKNLPISQLYNIIMADEKVRSFIDWELPNITNITNSLNLYKGSMSVIRMDSLGNGIGLKKPVIGTLLTYHLIRKVKSNNIPIGIIDGGNYNTGLALAHYAKLFSIRATLVHSRYFPSSVKIFLKKNSFGFLELLEAPAQNLGIEREFYKFLVDTVRFNDKFNKYIPLWHAKYSGLSLLPYGKEIAKRIESCPDFIVLSIGAGSNLEGIVFPILSKFKNKPKVIIIEHYLSPLVQKPSFQDLDFSFMNDKNYDYSWLADPPKGIPHFIAGPHYNELNPFISKNVINKIDYVYRYTEDQWKWMASYCKEKDISVGNSSSANLAVSRAISEKGYNVFTFINEPFRPFYAR